MSILLGWQILKRLGMGNFHEQCVYVKFCFTLGKLYSHTFENLKHTIKDEAIITTQTHDQY
jgi:hypothetical protein